MNGKIKERIIVTGTVAAALTSAFLLGKTFQENQMPTEKVDNENSVVEIATAAPTATTTEGELTEVNTNIFDYVVNEKSKKFHLPDCYSVSTMTEENKTYYSGNREELTKQGYEALLLGKVTKP